MSTEFPPDGSGPSDVPGREAPATSGSPGTGGAQDGWQAPDAGAFTEAPSYPAPGSAPSSQYPGYGGYHTPPVGQPGYPGSSGPGNTPYPSTSGGPGTPGAPGAPGYPGYGGYTSVLAPKPSIIPLRPLSIGEILGGAFESLRANPKAMFIPSLVVMGITGLLSAGSVALFMSRLGLTDLTSGKVEFSETDLDSIGSSLVGLLIQLGVTGVLSMLATSIIIGLIIVTVSRTILGRKASLSDVWKRTRPRMWALIGQTLLIELILAVITAVATAIVFGIGWALLGNIIAYGADEDSAGTIILAILAILAVIAVLGLLTFALICKLSLAPAALVLENIGVLEGISRSWTLTRGYFWRIVGIRLLSFLIVLVASQAASYGVSLITQGLVYAAPDAVIVLMALSTLLNSLVQAAILPFDSSVIALMYTDLRMRSEGLDVELRHAAGV